MISNRNLLITAIKILYRSNCAIMLNEKEVRQPGGADCLGEN